MYMNWTSIAQFNVADNRPTELDHSVAKDFFSGKTRMLATVLQKLLLQIQLKKAFMAETLSATYVQLLKRKPTI